MSNLVDYVPTASALFTAIAAFAAWAAVVQNTQASRERRQPVLLGAAWQLHSEDENARSFLSILNTGGTAKDVTCVFVVGDHYVTNRVGPGFLRNQQEAKVEVVTPPSSEMRAILICRDMKQQVCAWDLGRNGRTYNDRAATAEFDTEGLWFDFYGEELSLLTRVGSKVSL
jgi:hypothetical protein